ncbi:hypothetical protein D049_1532A, partial [Vibrio parahaemolyticus VPTS-2010]
MFAAF